MTDNNITTLNSNIEKEILEQLLTLPSHFHGKLSFPEDEEKLLHYMKADNKDSYIQFIKVWKHYVKEIEAKIKKGYTIEFHHYKDNVYYSVVAHNLYALRRAGKKWAQKQYELNQKEVN